MHDKRFPITILKLADLVLVVSAFGLSTVLVVQEQRQVSLELFLSMRTKVSAARS